MPWITSRGTNARTSHNNAHTSIAASAWNYALAGANVLDGTPIISIDGYVYFTEWTGTKVYLTSLTSAGALRWSVKLVVGGVDAYIRTRDLFGIASDKFGNVIVYAEADYTVFLLIDNTGVIQFEVNSTAGVGLQSATPVYENDGNGYYSFIVSVGGFQVIRVYNSVGALLGSHVGGVFGACRAGIVASDGTNIYQTNDSDPTVAVSKMLESAGPDIWTVSVPGADNPSGAVIYDSVLDQVYVPQNYTLGVFSGDATLNCRKGSDGSSVWIAHDLWLDVGTSMFTTITPAIDSSGNLYVPSATGGATNLIRKINGSTGATIWEVAVGTDGDPVGVCSVGCDGVLYHGAQIYRLNSASGAILETGALPNTGQGGMQPVLGDTLILAANLTDQTLYAFNTTVCSGPTLHMRIPELHYERLPAPQPKKKKPNQFKQVLLEWSQPANAGTTGVDTFTD